MSEKIKTELFTGVSDAINQLYRLHEKSCEFLEEVEREIEIIKTTSIDSRHSTFFEKKWHQPNSGLTLGSYKYKSKRE